MPRLGTILKIGAAVAVIGVATGTVPAALGSASARVPAGPAGHPAVLKIVYQVGRNHGASDKVMLAAFEACAVESNCTNPKVATDHDSLGAFQQRPSQGWGSPAEVTDVRYAARQFVTRAIAAEGCCATSGQLAQHVQRSAYPYRYDEAEARARALLAKAARLNGGTP
jgi:hypothetical protein